MKKKVLYLITGLLLLPLTACNNADEGAQTAEQGEGLVPITLQTAVMDLSTRAGQNIQSTLLEKNEEINVYINEIIPPEGEAGASYSSKYEYKVSDNAGSLKPMSLSSPYYPLNSNHVAITAIYPKKMTNSLAQDFSVESDQRQTREYKLSDLMYSDNLSDQEKQTGAITLIFNHLLCKVNVNLEMYHADNETPNNAPLEGSRIYLKDVLRTVSFNGKTGQISEASNSGDIYVSSNGRYAASAIIVPQSIPSRNFIRIEMATNKDVMNYTLPAPINFQAGKAYTFNIMVKQDAVIVGEYTIQDWDDSPTVQNKNGQFVN